MVPRALLLLASCLAAPARAAAESCVAPTCTYLPCEAGKNVGTCNLLACSAGHGAVECVGGNCVCSGANACAGADGYTCTTAKTCQRQVGTCSYMSCSGSHGATECVNGLCLCSAGTCTTDGAKCLQVLPTPAPTPSNNVAAGRRRHGPRSSVAAAEGPLLAGAASPAVQIDAAGATGVPMYGASAPTPPPPGFQLDAMAICLICVALITLAAIAWALYACMKDDGGKKRAAKKSKKPRAVNLDAGPMPATTTAAAVPLARSYQPVATMPLPTMTSPPVYSFVAQPMAPAAGAVYAQPVQAPSVIAARTYAYPAIGA
eukprot:TRINITY_DN2155_c2_g1_i1.p1 TRINITY_DN2155_c2_g1~~TRINITY_DN2155_c2_g1_i1.p1  ORF type:complete len:317 (-),score=47.70 TRINITY_DN2155_c2_g1_i1:30-980(-)